MVDGGSKAHHACLRRRASCVLRGRKTVPKRLLGHLQTSGLWLEIRHALSLSSNAANLLQGEFVYLAPPPPRLCLVLHDIHPLRKERQDKIKDALAGEGAEEQWARHHTGGLSCFRLLSSENISTFAKVSSSFVPYQQNTHSLY